MCNFPSIKDAADVAIAAMLSGIQVEIWLFIMFQNLTPFTGFLFILARYQG